VAVDCAATNVLPERTGQELLSELDLILANSRFRRKKQNHIFKGLNMKRPKTAFETASPEATRLRAYVLIQTIPGRVEGIMRALRRMPAIRTVDSVTGPYDIVALVEVSEIRDFSHLVAGSIGGLRGVTRTTTLLCT
jgi:DNA-binding Lrp family transcriptional regulator